MHTMSDHDDLLRRARAATEGEHRKDYGDRELRELVHELANALQWSAAAERERCAQVAQDFLTNGRSPLGLSVAKAIRQSAPD